MSVGGARPRKRPRQDRSSVYRDSIPFDEDYEIVQSREGRLRRVGERGLLTAVLPRDSFTGTLSSAWTMLASWAPPDDNEYALDPDENLYTRLLDSNVMEEQSASPKPTKKKRSKVSVRIVVTLIISEISDPFPTETSACRMDGVTSSKLS